MGVRRCFRGGGGRFRGFVGGRLTGSEEAGERGRLVDGGEVADEKKEEEKEEDGAAVEWFAGGFGRGWILFCGGFGGFGFFRCFCFLAFFRGGGRGFLRGGGLGGFP